MNLDPYSFNRHMGVSPNRGTLKLAQKIIMGDPQMIPLSVRDPIYETEQG